MYYVPTSGQKANWTSTRNTCRSTQSSLHANKVCALGDTYLTGHFHKFVQNASMEKKLHDRNPKLFSMWRSPNKYHRPHVRLSNMHNTKTETRGENTRERDAYGRRSCKNSRIPVCAFLVSVCACLFRIVISLIPLIFNCTRICHTHINKHN